MSLIIASGNADFSLADGQYLTPIHLVGIIVTYGLSCALLVFAKYVHT